MNVQPNCTARRGIYYVALEHECRHWSGLVSAWDARLAGEWARIVFSTALRHVYEVEVGHHDAIATHAVEEVQPPVGSPPPDPEDLDRGSWVEGGENLPPIRFDR